MGETIILDPITTYTVIITVKNSDRDPLKHLGVILEGEGAINTGNSNQAIFTNVSESVTPLDITVLPTSTHHGNNSTVRVEPTLGTTPDDPTADPVITKNITLNKKMGNILLSIQDRIARDLINTFDIQIDGNTYSFGGTGSEGGDSPGGDSPGGDSPGGEPGTTGNIISNIAYGTYWYRLYADGYLDDTGNLVVDEPEETVILAMNPVVPITHDITFSVVDDENNPIPKAYVMLGSNGKKTDDAGTVLFEDVGEGNNKYYKVSRSGYYDKEGTINVNDDKTINIVLFKTTYNVDFYIENSDGTILRNVTVTLLNTITGAEVGSGVVNQSGFIRFPVESGKYTVNITKSDYIPYSNDIIIDQDYTDVVILEEESTPVYNASVIVSVTPPEGTDSSDPLYFPDFFMDGVKVLVGNRGTKETDNEGKVLFQNLSEGSYDYTAFKEAFSAVIGSISVRSNVTISFSVTPMTQLVRLVVKDTQGKNIPGVDVTITNVSRSHGSLGLTRTLYKKGGAALEFDTIWGTVDITFDKSGYTTKTITIETGTDESGNLITWGNATRGGSYPNGYVTSISVKNVTVILMEDSAPTYDVTFNIFENFTLNNVGYYLSIPNTKVTLEGKEARFTNGAGEITFSNIARETYNVIIKPPYYRTRTLSLPVDSDITQTEEFKDGDYIRPYNIKVIGKKESGEELPLEDAHLELSKVGSNKNIPGVTNEEGIFEYTGVELGNYELTFVKDGYISKVVDIIITRRLDNNYSLNNFSLNKDIQQKDVKFSLTYDTLRASYNPVIWLDGYGDKIARINGDVTGSPLEATFNDVIIEGSPIEYTIKDDTNYDRIQGNVDVDALAVATGAYVVEEELEPIQIDIKFKIVDPDYNPLSAVSLSYYTDYNNTTATANSDMYGRLFITVYSGYGGTILYYTFSKSGYNDNSGDLYLNPNTGVDE